MSEPTEQFPAYRPHRGACALERQPRHRHPALAAYREAGTSYRMNKPENEGKKHPCPTDQPRGVGTASWPPADISTWPLTACPRHRAGQPLSYVCTGQRSALPNRSSPFGGGSPDSYQLVRTFGLGDDTSAVAHDGDQSAGGLTPLSGTERDCPTLKNSATADAPSASTNFRAFPSCQAHDVSGSWLS